MLGRRANLSDRPGGPEADPVTDPEIEKMAAVVRQAVAAGALGFSTSRLLLHRDNRGILTPGALAAKKEMLRLCDAVAAGGGGVFEMSADFSAYDDIPYHKLDRGRREAFFWSELGWMEEAMATHRDRLRVTFGTGPARVPFFADWAGKVSQSPGQCMVQFQTRPQSFHMSLASGKHLFSATRTYRVVRKQTAGDMAALIAALRDPLTRRAILAEMAEFAPSGRGVMTDRHTNRAGATVPSWMITCDEVYPWVGTYEPTPASSVPAIAVRTGKPTLEVAYDALLDLSAPHRGVLWRPLFGYPGNNDQVCNPPLLPPLCLVTFARSLVQTPGPSN